MKMPITADSLRVVLSWAPDTALHMMVSGKLIKKLKL